MNVGMIYPFREQCGIAEFTRSLIVALKENDLNIVEIDSDRMVSEIVREASKCDVVHIQYEISFFMRGKKDIYPCIMKCIGEPSVVSLHEIYRQHPFVFPRSKIKGRLLIKWLKQIKWDRKHLMQRFEREHRKRFYYAKKVLVFYQYQKKIAVEWGITDRIINVLPMPIPVCNGIKTAQFSMHSEVHFGIVGFVNASYDVDLLFKSLQCLRRPWTCTWLGGTPTANAKSVQDTVIDRVKEHSWNDRFIFTGWLPKDAFLKQLSEFDIILALFRYRSSSSSITVAMGAGKPVIASRIPLTEEIAYTYGSKRTDSPILLVDDSPEEVAETIDRYLSDSRFRQQLQGALHNYTSKMSFQQYASSLETIYQGIIGT